MSLLGRRGRRKSAVSKQKHKGARCRVCGGSHARVTSVLSTGGTRRRKTVCMSPSCRAEVA